MGRPSGTITTIVRLSTRWTVNRLSLSTGMPVCEETTTGRLPGGAMQVKLNGFHTDTVTVPGRTSTSGRGGGGAGKTRRWTVMFDNFGGIVVITLFWRPDEWTGFIDLVHNLNARYISKVNHCRTISIKTFVWRKAGEFGVTGNMLAQLTPNVLVQCLPQRSLLSKSLWDQ